MNFAINLKTSAQSAYRDIYEKYVDNASFLWVLRSIAVDQPHFFLEDIQELDQRIEAQLDGLMTSVELAWPICVEALELAEPGEVFTATVISFRSHDVEKIQKAVEVGLSNDQALKGLISALAWLPGKLVHSWIKKFFTSKDLKHKFLAVAACSVRRENPEEYLNRILEREDCKDDIRLYSRSLRIIGELRRLDLIPQLEEALLSKDRSVLFWANWSSILLGNRDLVKNLERYVLNPGPFQIRAINIAFRVLPIELARTWISNLAKVEGQIRNVIRATAILGDPHAVNWLINKMQDDNVAKISGEAFCLITGIDIAQHQLINASKSEQKLQDEEEEEAESVELDEDENLLWPDAVKIKKLWMQQGKNFIAGQRYILGKPINTDWLKSKLSTVGQRQRHAVAMELALLGDVPLINTRSVTPA